MFRVSCGSQKEKVQWIEASEILSKMKGINTNNSVINFLTKLYKEPGYIDIISLPEDKKLKIPVIKTMNK